MNVLDFLNFFKFLKKKKGEDILEIRINTGSSEYTLHPHILIEQNGSCKIVFEMAGDPNALANISEIKTELNVDRHHDLYVCIDNHDIRYIIQQFERDPEKNKKTLEKNLQQAFNNIIKNKEELILVTEGMD